MSSLSSFKNPAAYHLLSYGTLLGSTLFQSFIGGIIAFRALPRPMFSTLQKATFPAYFTLQSITPVLMILTYPSSALSRSVSNTLSSSLASSSSSWGYSALLHPSSYADKLAASLIGIMLVTGLVNLVYVGPKTTDIMRLRKHQETRDGKKSYDAGPHSPEMQRLNRQFGMLHGISSLTNLVGFLGMCWYGVLLGEAFRV